MSTSLKIVKTTALEIRDTSLIADISICNATFGDFRKICRLCIGRENIKPFFDMTYKQTSLQSIIYDCSSLKVNSEDGLPYNLCETCVTKLIRFYSFKKRCIQVGRALQESYDNRNFTKEDNKTIQTINSQCCGRNEVKSTIKKKTVDISISKEAFGNFKKICRLCSGNENIKPFVNMTYKHTSVQSIIYDCLSLKVNPEDGLPYNLCKTCITELMGFYRFKNSCMEVNRILQDAYENRNFTTEEEKEKPINSGCYGKNQVNLIIKKEEIEDPLSISEDTNTEGYIVDKMENIISDDNPYTCSICMKSFRRKYHLTRHMFAHSGERPHKCDTCGKFFAQKFHLTKHMFIHTGEKPHKCKVCKKTFRIRHQIKGHTVIHTCGRRNTCSVCKKSFMWKHMLDNHMSIHTGERPHKCSVCKKTFRQKTRLGMHMSLHTGERPYKCSVCENSFKQKSTLNVHMLVHTGERPHKCSVCKRAFTQKTRLSEHMLVHTGERPCKCSVCEKSFRQKSTLSQHMLIHTGEKPHKCSVCEKSFNKKSTLKRHISKHGKNAKVIKDKD